MGASTLNKKELFRLHMGEVKNDYATLMGDCEYYESQIESLQAENARLRELAKGMYGLLETYDKIMGSHDACETPRPLIFDDCKSFKDVARELGLED